MYSQLPFSTDSVGLIKMQRHYPAYVQFQKATPEINFVKY